MPDTSQMADTLLVEHLRWTPLSMIDDIINSINELLYRAVEAVESGLLAAPPSSLGFESSSAASNGDAKKPTADTDTTGDEVLSPEARSELENGVHQLETLLESSVDRNFDKLEIYLLRGVFTIPPELVNWVRLAHYENLPHPLSPDAPTPTSISLQRRQLHETQRLHTALLREHQRNAALLAQLRHLLPSPSPTTSLIDADPDSTEDSPFAFLTTHPLASSLAIPTTSHVSTSSTSSHTAQPLATTTQFLTSQLPALRSLLARLRPSQQALLKPTDATDVTSEETDGKRQERTRYVEERVQRHLERTGRGIDAEGLEAGEWTSGGRRIGGEEVERLERLVGTLGDSAEKRDVTDVREDEEMDA